MDTQGSHTIDEVLAYVDRFASDKPANASQAILWFLYKEILVNRILILEKDPVKNRGGIEHNEKVINDLNRRLMDALAKGK